MFYYLGVVAAVYALFLLAQRRDRARRRELAARLGALYRLRSEFWRLRAWADEARRRGDEPAAAELNSQAAEQLPGINRQTSAVRKEFNDYMAEIGWLPGGPDEELRDMGESVTIASMIGYDRWITGKGRVPVDSVLNPRPRIEEDALAGRMHMAFGIVLGLVLGFAVSLRQGGGTTTTMLVYMGISALVLGYVGAQAKDHLWYTLGRVFRWGRWV